MNQKHTILFLVHGFSIGGVQKANISMINKIDRAQFNIHVLYIDKGDKTLFGDMNVDGISISRLGSTLKLYSISNIAYVCRVAKYIKDNDVDVVHTIDPILYIIGATACRLTKCKHVRTQPNFIRRHERLNTKTLRILPFERWTDKFITYQYGSAQDLNMAGVEKEKIVTVQGFSRPEEFLYYNDIKDIRGELNIPQNHKIILAMHRMVEKKGYETFIDMIPFIVESFPLVTFLLVGDGPMRHQYEKRVEELGIKDHVRFAGFRKDIANIIKQVDFGVYPLADTAAMGTVIRSGKVLITRKNSSMDEYIVDGVTGYLVPDDKPETYAEFSLKLLRDEKLLESMEESQRKHVLENFDGIKNMKILENTFKSLIKK